VPHPCGIITLLTDFGERDWFVAGMKGVILSINPQATIVDLCHRVPPHAVGNGAYVLKSCYRSFPAGTVHVAVVDPGVGGARRPILVRTDQYYFLAPDNGLLSYVLAEGQNVEARILENKQYGLASEGSTFDGRDVFVPAAAWLTKQRPVSSFGRTIADPFAFKIRSPRWEQQRLVGEVVYVDHFGNLITNFTQGHLLEVQTVTKRHRPSVCIGDHLTEGLVESYEEGSHDSPRALINSNGWLEIFVKEASAASRLQVGCGEPVKLSEGRRVEGPGGESE
jgi:hypothetical protein